jgi:hypothetical protein
MFHVPSIPNGVMAGHGTQPLRFNYDRDGRAFHSNFESPFFDRVIRNLRLLTVAVLTGRSGAVRHFERIERIRHAAPVSCRALHAAEPVRISAHGWYAL